MLATAFSADGVTKLRQNCRKKERSSCSRTFVPAGS